MSTLDRAKDEAQRIANEMRSGAEKARSSKWIFMVKFD
jgi:hypothetical protein